MAPLADKIEKLLHECRGGLPLDAPGEIHVTEAQGFDDPAFPFAEIPFVAEVDHRLDPIGPELFEPFLARLPSADQPVVNYGELRDLAAQVLERLLRIRSGRFAAQAGNR